MLLMTKLDSWMLGLPRAMAPRLEYQIDLRIPMPDGVVLLANRIAPRGGEDLPIILIRNPCSPRGKKPDFVSRLIAERGYQVVAAASRCRAVPIPCMSATWERGSRSPPFVIRNGGRNQHEPPHTAALFMDPRGAGTISAA